MSQETGNADDRLLSETEVRRLESEIAKNEAERAKLALETQWYSRRLLIQALVGGVVVAALALAWLFGFYQPVFEPLLEQEQNIQRLRIEQIVLKNEVERLGIQQENQKLAESQAESESLIVRLQERLDALSDDYSKLAEIQQLPREERNRFATLAKEAKADSVTIERQTQQLQIAQEETEKRTQRIEYRSQETISDISFRPPSPAELKLNDSIAVEFTYSTVEPGDVRIFVHPFTKGKLSPGNAASKPIIYATGSGSAKATIKNSNTPGTIDQLRFQMISNDTLKVLREIFVPVQFAFQ